MRSERPPGVGPGDRGSGPRMGLAPIYNDFVRCPLPSWVRNKWGRHARKRWKAFMRALHGNTPPSERLEVAFFNTRQLRALPGKEAKGKEVAAEVTGEDKTEARARASKLAWMAQTLASTAPDVVFLAEVHGTISEMNRGLRTWARRLGYVARFLPGEGGSGREVDSGSHANGMVVLGRMDAGAFASGDRKATLRVEERVFGVQWIAKADGRCRRIAAVHGLHGEGDCSFSVQLQAAFDWLEEDGGGLLVGDLNRVPCKNWRSSGRLLDEDDVALRGWTGWTCACCKVSVPAAVAQRGQVVEWYSAANVQGRHTRFDGKGGGARYDIGIEVGKDLNRWRSEGETTARAGEVGRKKDRVISDHVWARWSTPYKAVVKKGEEREAPALRGDGKAARQVKAAYKAALRTAECKEAMAGQILASAAEGRSAVQAGSRWLVQQGRMASAQVLAETTRACSETMHCAYNRWTWALKQIVAGRARGEDVRELSGGLMHPKLGLHTILRRRGVEFMSRLQVWRELEDFVRRQLRRTGGRAARVMKAKDAELITTASKIVADGFANAVVNLQRAWRAVKAKRQSIALSAVHVADDPSGRKVEADEQDFLQVLRDVGVTMVERFADTPPSLEAFRAWHHVFLEQYEELKGSDGETWEWEKELTWDIFKEVLRCIPRGKAVGAGAFNIELLLHAGDRIQRIFYEALMMDLRNGVMSEDWHRVLYVLLVKPPPDDPNLVSGRREIALMAQDMKLLMHMLRITAYRRVTGRLLAAQCGWLPGYGATDPGLTMQMVLQQARRLKCDIYLLYIDLSTMFPRLDRQAMDMAEALIGLPAEVRDLVHRIYGAGREDQEAAVRCQFDSAAGLSEPFRNYMGALMGDVLSPDRAKILLNTILQAIAACARGFKLWGHEKQTRWIEQLSYADDWVGIFNSSEALQAAWAVWTAWIAVSGCKLGFKSASDGTPLKTAVTGMRHVAGVAREIENPKLSTPAGQVVQTLGMDEAYKYLGMWRCASGAEAKGRKALQSKMMAAVARMGKMYRPSRADFVMVANGLLGGLATYYLATEYVSFQELDVKVEARWRRHYARMFKREVSRPNVQLYESVQTARGARRQAPARRHRIHVSTFGQAALYSTICKAMADVHDTQQRAAVRSGLALAAVRWGCREDPSTWDCRHIKGALEAALRTGAGYVADAWWLAVIVLREQVEGAEDKPWEEVWRWMHGSAGPLDASSEHFGPPRSQMVFEPTSSGGLGAPVAGGLIGAGLVAVGHFCVCRWKGATEAGRWAEDFVEARRRHPLLQSTHKQEYEETVAWLAEAAEPAAPEGTRFTYVSERSVFGVQAAVSQTVAKVCLTEAAALVAALQADSVEPLVVAAEWEGMIRAAFQGVEKAPAVPWQMGAPTWEEMALGPRLLVDFGSKLQCTGGGGHWREREAAAADPEILGSTARAAIGPDGYVVGWQREAARLVAQVQFDAHGWPLWTGSRQRVTMVEAESMEPGPRLLVRSRLSLGEVTVIDKPVCKRPKLGTFVNVRALRAMWRKLCTWQARVQATSAWTLDGTRKVVSDADGKEKLVVARAAVSSSGEVTGGILEEEELVDNYLAELAAQIDVFEHMAEGERPLVIFDATSPVLAMLTFRRLQGRARQGRLVATWLATLEKLMRKCEAVVWIWQSSHVGEPCNEAADCAADAAAAAEGDAPLPRLRCEFASVTFPMHRGAAFSWALPLAARATAARLRGTAARSLRHTEGIHFPVPLLGEAAEDARLAIASDRCQVADDGHYYGKAFQREVSAMVCPHGCTEADGAGSRPDWMHAAFRCTGRAVAGARKRWRLCLDKVVTRLSQLQSKNGGGPQIQLAYLKRALGESSERGVAMAAFPPHLRRGSLGATTMREAICMHLEMIHKPGVDSDAAFLRLLAAMGEAGLQVQLAYGTATTVMVDAAHRRATDLALCGKLLRGWQAHVVRHSSPASCTKWRELRRAWQLTRAAAQRMVEDATTVTARLQAARRNLCSEVEVAVLDHLSSDARSVSRRHRLWGTACWWARWAKYVRACRAARGAVRGGGQRESRMLSILLTAARGDRGQLRGRVPPLSERSWRAWTRGALRRWHRGGGFATVEADKAKEALESRKRRREEEKAAEARSAAALATFVARGVVVRLRGCPILWRHSFGSCSGQVLAAVDEPIVFDFAAEEDGTVGMRRRQRGAQRAARRRIAARRNEREAARRWEDGVRSTGAEADDGGRWAIAEIVSVWRPLPRRGRQLDVLVRWAGAAEEVTWEPINRRRFTPDQYALARRMETVRYGVQAGPPAVAVRAASRKTPRLAAAAAVRRSAADAAAAVGKGRSVRQRGLASELSSDGEASSSPQAVSSDSGCSDSEISD